MIEKKEHEPVEELLSPERWNRLQTVFDAALAVGPDSREQFLNRACEGDRGLCREVESLLAADDTGDDLMQNGVSELCMKVMAETLKDDSDEQGPSQDGVWPGLILNNRWKILTALDEGGMGQVYRAEDLTLNRPAVVKVLKRDSQKNPWKVKKFGHEADAQSRLKHANVAMLFDKGSLSSGEQYLVMEFIKGKTLRQLMNDHKMNDDQIDFSMIGEIMKQAGRGVAAIHQAGLVHRDLKPENIMIPENGDELEVKIIDFGIVRVLDRSTVVGQLVGSVYYMAPEQLRGEDATTGCDVYALAAIAYELLTGRRPFEVGNVSNMQVAIKHLLDLQANSVKFKPRELREGLSREADRLVLQGLSLEAHKRPGARQFTKELARMLNLESPPSPLPARRWWLVAAGIVLAMALGLTVWGLVKKTNQPGNPGLGAIADQKPERVLTYWLTVTRKKDGKTIPATGRETFATGDEFRLNFLSPDAGVLYLFNEGTSGHWHVLFPTRQNNLGKSGVAASQTITTKENVFTDQSGTEKGTEKIWVVWASTPIQALEDIVHQSFGNDLVVSDVNQQRTLSEFLKKAESKSDVGFDKEQSRVTLKGRSQSLVYLVELEHQDWK